MSDVPCYFCERRWPESAEMILGGCECCEFTCEDCLLCTKHCECQEDCGPIPLPTAIVSAKERDQ
ncbi:hypothetical protein AYO40_04800 [Planctomycetaceae bacterium SCGC AG-212-D15]|nr:hypothetical protein AYO40_04800 [Planctomycetaceae bacterium SCGC AG-212-D15]